MNRNQGKQKDAVRDEIVPEKEELSPDEGAAGATAQEETVTDQPDGEGSIENKTANEQPSAGQATAKLQDELAEARDKFLRLYSEFENFRRRTAKERLELMQTANEALVLALLPISDDFERAEKSMKEGEELEGFKLIHNKFRKVLEQYGAKVMKLEPGDDFDADLHEAITQIPAPEEKFKGKIVEVIEKGYLLNEKVIRFARVVVGS